LTPCRILQRICRRIPRRVVAPQTGAPVNLAETKEFNTEWGSQKQDGLFRLWDGKLTLAQAA